MTARAAAIFADRRIDSAHLHRRRSAGHEGRDATPFAPRPDGAPPPCMGAFDDRGAEGHGCEVHDHGRCCRLRWEWGCARPGHRRCSRERAPLEAPCAPHHPHALCGVGWRINRVPGTRARCRGAGGAGERTGSLVSTTFGSVAAGIGSRPVPRAPRRGRRPSRVPRSLLRDRLDLGALTHSQSEASGSEHWCRKPEALARASLHRLPRRLRRQLARRTRGKHSGCR